VRRLRILPKDRTTLVNKPPSLRRRRRNAASYSSLTLHGTGVRKSGGDRRDPAPLSASSNGTTIWSENRICTGPAEKVRDKIRAVRYDGMVDGPARCRQRSGRWKIRVRVCTSGAIVRGSCPREARSQFVAGFLQYCTVADVSVECHVTLNPGKVGQRDSTLCGGHQH
jgi:hypothetical protein